MTERSCPACGQSVSHATSSAPFVGLLRILELCWRERHALPADLVERIREQLEGPFAPRLKTDQRALDAMGRISEERIRNMATAPWLREQHPEDAELGEAELARRGLK